MLVHFVGCFLFFWLKSDQFSSSRFGTVDSTAPRRACTAQFEAWSCSSWRSPHHGPPTSMWHARAQRHQKWALASIREGLCMKCWVRSQGTANMSLTNTCMQIQKTVEEHSERWRSGFVRINQSCSTTKKGSWDLANTETKPGTGSLRTIEATQIMPSQSPTPPVLCGGLHYMPRRSDKQGNEGEMVHPDVGDRVAFCEMSLIGVLWAGTTIAHCFWLEWIIRLRFLWPCMAAQPQMLPRKKQTYFETSKEVPQSGVNYIERERERDLHPAVWAENPFETPRMFVIKLVLLFGCVHEEMATDRRRPDWAFTVLE